jgi:2'-5' RNA ligase
VRLFVAIELDHPIKRALLHVADSLKDFRRTVRWASEHQMHLTLKFLGEVPDDKVPAVTDACARIAAECEPFEFVLNRAGCFPPEGRVRIVWGGSSVMPEELDHCVHRCEEVFEEIGFSKENRPFTPHVTIGRVKVDDTRGRLRHAVNDLRITRVAEHVDSMTLFQSILSPAGARYVVAGSFPFGQGKTDPPGAE